MKQPKWQERLMEALGLSVEELKLTGYTKRGRARYRPRGWKERKKRRRKQVRSGRKSAGSRQHKASNYRGKPRPHSTRSWRGGGG